MGDDSLDIEPGKVVKSKVNCPECILVVEFCHGIDKKEFVNNQKK